MAKFDFIMHDMLNKLAFEEKFGLLGEQFHADDQLDMEFNDDFDRFMCDGEL